MDQTLPLVIVTATWAGYNTAASSYNRLSEKRNAIVTPKVGDRLISKEIRTHMFLCDWLPEWIGGIVINIAFAIAIYFAPSFG
jgi:hypothetical protein